ncbi:MAG TPA: thiamine pyrophosphate-dependent dehydrogenase E1 component subunit alpha [Candidatus Limnocylindria bacterium]|nr:thiamine pyrophosphate-dependent dehydrogenase E1 component subunit alpha [Candidatus Limnocylindria bacterium]
MTQSLTHESIRAAGRYDRLSLTGVEPRVLQALFRFMLRLRLCEEALVREYHPADEMKCPVHFCIGQEAVPAGLAPHLRREDYLYSHHRTHGYFFAKGAPMRALFAELHGRETGANGGKAGSQDISMTSHHMYGGAILAGAISIAVGTAVAAQLRKADYIAVSGFGDAATEEGAFWEAISYAVLRKLPLVFICENNGYSVYSHQLKRQPADNISARVAAFGMRTVTIFGNDAVECYRVLGDAVARARRGEGPTFIEAYTYRWSAHVGPENDDWIGYRADSERDFWKENDPIVLLEEKLRAASLLSDAQRRDTEKEIQLEIADAFSFAKSSPFPRLTDWTSMNLSAATPMADRLLSDLEAGDFDHDQPDLIPGPY